MVNDQETMTAKVLFEMEKDFDLQVANVSNMLAAKLSTFPAALENKNGKNLSRLSCCRRLERIR